MERARPRPAPTPHRGNLDARLHQLHQAFEVRGYDSLEVRVRTSYEKWVRDGRCLFRPRNADRHHGAVRFLWEMVSVNDGRVVFVGLEFLLLAGDGRIHEDYQFIQPAA